MPPVPSERAIAISVLDAATGEPVTEFRVLAGTPSRSLTSREFSQRVGGDAKHVANWQSHTLRVGGDGKLTWPVGRSYAEMALRVEADGYRPQRSAWITKGSEPGQLEFFLVEDPGVEGRVLHPDGTPVATALVALGLPSRSITLRQGRLQGADQPPAERESNPWRRPVMVETDADGRFRLPFESEIASVVLVVHEAGVRELPYADFQQQPELTLQPWGRIEGQVLWKDTPGAGQDINLTIFRDEYGYPGMVECYAEARSDAEGRFVFERVLPGHAQISQFIRLAEPHEQGASAVALPGLYTHVTVNSGEPTAVLIGGQGRTVKGRLTGRTSWDNVTFHFHPNAPHPSDRAGWAASWIFRSKEYGPLFFRDGLKPEADGSFEIPYVLPGIYQLFVSAPDVTNYAGYRRFSVDAETPGEAPPELDLGEIKVKTAIAADAARQ